MSIAYHMLQMNVTDPQEKDCYRFTAA